jgi:hypothetical protein
MKEKIPTVLVGVRLPENVAEALKARALKERRTVASMAKILLEDSLKDGTTTGTTRQGLNQKEMI